MGFCARCGSWLHKTPWVSSRSGTYAFLCTEQCKEAYDNETYRIAWTQRSLELGPAAFNGA